MATGSEALNKFPPSRVDINHLFPFHAQDAGHFCDKAGRNLGRDDHVKVIQPNGFFFQEFRDPIDIARRYISSTSGFLLNIIVI